MSDIDRIKQPIAADLVAFDNYFRQAMKTNVPLLNLVMRYLLKRKGKQMRPILVFLTARLLGTPNESTHTAAALIEMLHTATLIHDDVVDDSHERRGFFSINALWKSKISVLLGDYLLAKGLLLAISHKEYEILSLVADAVREMSEGELQQIKNSRKLNISQDDYYEIIRKKTATLISCCSSCGAKSVGMPDDTVNRMKRFGELLGIAFQIKDDILDYQINSLTGKPKGNDIQERKLTLPLIHALETAERSDRKIILKILNQTGKNSYEFHTVLDFINRFNGLTFAEERMNDFASQALQELDPFPENNIKTALREFVSYTICRNK
jgi:octaprenyl-diphosphate synthase